MPWDSGDALRHTSKAKSAIAQRQWRDVANSVLARTGDDGQAVRAANAAVAKRGRGRSSDNVVRKAR